MNTDTIKTNIPDYAKDIRLNISSLLKDDANLSMAQLASTALACAYATKNTAIVNDIFDATKEHLDDASITAAKSAASIMAMNNVYYRFTHMASDKQYSTMPAKLRMNVIGKPGVDKIDFELMSLAISAISGCGLCIDAHIKTLEKSGVSSAAIQDSIRLASVVNALATVYSIEA